MTQSSRIPYNRAWFPTALIVVALLSFPGLSLAESEPVAFGIGDHEKGSLSVPLYRGAAEPFEIYVLATPNNCEGEMRLDLEWDKSKNYVKMDLTGGPGSMEAFPDVDRTEGVNFFHNPFNLQPVDFEDGRYQLWLISAAGPLLTFYYDSTTLDLLGSELDFETPPAGSIPQPFPTLYLIPTPFFQPAADGSVDLHWEFAYDHAVRGDRPDLAHFYITFPPPNLCLANPFRLDQSTLRAYISDPVPETEARPWSDYLRGGMLFDITVEPPEYHLEPPHVTFVATYSGGTATSGTVPRDYTMDIDAAFMNVAPPIKPWAGAGTCQDHFAGFHTMNINFCGAP